MNPSKVCLVYVESDKTNRVVALKLKKFLEKKGFSVSSVKLFAGKPVLKGFDLKKFDLIVVGSPVRNFSPMEIVSDFLRKIKNANKKMFFLFSTCVALPGTTLKRMSNIVTTKSGIVVGAYTLRSLFEVDEKKISQLLDYFEKTVLL